jgi:hypothetical protein
MLQAFKMERSIILGESLGIFRWIALVFVKLASYNCLCSSVRSVSFCGHPA